jgi:dihydroorotate dehydrogenase (fumarate)
MGSLQTSYMGIALANPVVAGACDLTSNVDSIKRIEDAGAGAIVLKSLFEEQIQLERMKLEEDLDTGSELYGEMATIFPKLKHSGAKEHLLWVKKSREAVKLPLIASLNAVERGTWVEYAKQLADQGVNGLELNFFATPRDPGTSGADVEKEQLDAVRDVRRAVKLPLSVKLSVFYANPLNVIAAMDKEGINAFVLFNRFFQPDIDPETESMKQPFNFSIEADNRLPLRFAGLLQGKIKADICASTGIMNGMDVARMILAGATVVQVVTGLYRNGVKSLGTMTAELDAWMKGKSYATLDAFRGKLSAKNATDPWAYTRAQYAKMLLSPKEFTETVRL